MKAHLHYSVFLITIVLTILAPSADASYLKIVRAINCGGSAAGHFEADNSYSGGGIYETTATITPEYAPQEVLRTERNGSPSLTYTLDILLILD